MNKKSIYHFVRAAAQSNLAKNSLISFLLQFSRFALLAVWVMVLARALGATSYGLFSGIAAAATIVGTLSGLGQHMVLYQESIKNPNHFSALFFSSLKFTVITSIPLSILCSCIIFAIFPKVALITIMLIGLSEIVFFPLVTFCSTAFAAKRKIAMSTLIPSISALCRLLGVLYFVTVLSTHNIEDYALIHFLMSGLASTLVIYLTFKIINPIKNNAKPQSTIVSIGALFSINALTQSAISSLDKTLTLKLSTPENAGIYSVSTRLINVIMQPLEAIINAATPGFFSKKTIIKKETINLLLVFITYSILASAFIITCPSILTILMGDDFSAAESLLKILVIAIPIYAIRTLGGNLLLTKNMPSIKAKIDIISLAIMFAAGVCLIPNYGLIGSACMLIISEGTLAILYWCFIMRKFTRDQ